jgi:fungal STAND N-terminal Goodbye domain
MSQTQPTASCSSSNFQSLFNTALKEYEKKTKKDLLAHPLAAQLQSCYSTTAILAILEDQVQQFDQHRRADERLTKWLNPTVNVLYAFSAILGDGVGLVNFWYHSSIIHTLIPIMQVFSPAKVIFAGMGVLLLVSAVFHLFVHGNCDTCHQAAKDVDASQGVLVDLFERIEQFFKRLECYTEIRQTEAMTDIIVKIMVVVLSILAIATKEVKQSRASELIGLWHGYLLILYRNIYEEAGGEERY